MTNSHAHTYETGPFRAHQIEDGSPYELSNGHAIHCMTAGGRHGSRQLDGGKVLGTDPKVKGNAGIDVGYTWNDGENLRAPDLVVGNVERDVPGWQTKPPLLAVEYADKGQDEQELQKKIRELLEAGTQYFWVVRLQGPLRVEVYERNKPIQIVGADDKLYAPDVLSNPVSVRSLVDEGEANRAALTNLLNREGYQNLDEVRAEGRVEGRTEGELLGQAKALLLILKGRNLVVSEVVEQRIFACKDAAQMTRWLARSVHAASAEDVVEA